MESHELNVLRNDEHLLSAIWFDVSIMIWRMTVDETWIDKIERDSREMDPFFADKHAAIIILQGQRNTPSDDIRERMVQMAKANAPSLSALAHVIEGQGFHASVTQGVITEVEMKSNRSNRKTFRDVRQAIRWMTDHLGKDHAWKDALTSQVNYLLSLPQDSLASSSCPKFAPGYR